MDRADAVRSVIAQVCEQAPDASEVVVVDQSALPTREANAAWCAARGDRRIRFLTRDARGLPAARNAGLAASRAPVVLFLDDDVVLHAGCIAAHLARYRDPTVGGVVGQIHERRLKPNAWRTTNRIGLGGRILTRLDGPEPVAVESLKGANMSLRRVAIEQAGGFDPAFAGTALLEDADLSERVRRCGWGLVYEPEARVDHLHLGAGGCRVEGGDWQRTEWWRFHNTALWVRRHRGWSALPPLVATFASIAAHRAVFRSAPGAAVRLLGALASGWARGGDRGAADGRS